MRAGPLAALFLWACAAGAAAESASTSTAHVAVFRRTAYSLSMPLVDPFERLLRGGGTTYGLIRVENIASHLNGEEYNFRIPEHVRLEAPTLFAEKVLGPKTHDVETLETGGGLFAVFPPAPEFLAAVERAAKDPDSYPSGRVPLVERGRARWTRTPLAGGAQIHTVRLEKAHGVRYPQWRETIAVVYQLRIGAREHEAVFLYQTLGGEGRLAAALEGLRERHRELLVLNRGEIFVSGTTKTTGTAAGFRFESMGVAAAVPGSGEMSRWDDVMAYRAASPDGVRFLAANLVYSSDSAKTPLPPYAIFERGGLKIAVLGLMHRARRSYLPAAFAQTLTITDSVAAAQRWVPQLRREADVVIALSNLSVGRNTRLRRRVLGLDIVAGDDMRFGEAHALRTTTAEDAERGPHDEALLTTSDSATVFSHVALSRRPRGEGRYALAVRERHVMLDESLPDRPGFPKFQPAGYGVVVDTRAPVLPSTRRLYPEGEGFERLDARHFWSLAASLMARRTRAEAAVLPLFGISRQAAGDVYEDMVRDWFPWDDRLAVFELRGWDLRALIAEVRRQERPGESVPLGSFRLAAGGLGAGDTIHGMPIDGNAVYRVAATHRLLADKNRFPGLPGAARIKVLGSLREAVIDELRRAASAAWPDEKYRELLKGRPTAETGLWRVNFRDVNLNVSNTKVVADSAFADVPNSRVRGFDELLIGAGSKIDLEYLKGLYRWTNTLETEYSKSRLSPPGSSVLLNTPRNRVWFRTLGTMRVGSFGWSPLGKSYGPSFGAEYEGQLERLPLTRRRHIVSVLPGVELYDGTVLRSVQIAGNFRRDFTPLTPINNYGARLRALLSRPLKGMTLQGEWLSNYFFRTPQNTTQDLRFDSNATLKLHVPLYKDFSIAPFIDFYYFVLQVRPVTGYSSIMGLSLSFSRLWKPQYEGL